MAPTVITSTDCGTGEGITVGLVDAIMSISKVVRERLETYDSDQIPQSVLEALSDLFLDQDLRFIRSFGGNG